MSATTENFDPVLKETYVTRGDGMAAYGGFSSLKSRVGKKTSPASGASGGKFGGRRMEQMSSAPRAARPNRSMFLARGSK